MMFSVRYFAENHVDVCKYRRYPGRLIIGTEFGVDTAPYVCPADNYHV